jgi:predicted PurR-regulated permease PerM
MWLPHFFILGILALSLYFLQWVLDPLLPVLLMGAALSGLFYPISAGPIHIFLETRFEGRFSEQVLRQASGICATVLVILVAISPVIIAMVTLLGASQFTEGFTSGILTKNLDQINATIEQVTFQIKVLQELYPSLPIDPEWIDRAMGDAIKDFLALQPALMGFFFKGTGSFAVQALLCILSMTFFFAEGGVLLRAILEYTPLSNSDSEHLLKTFKKVVLRFLIDTLGTSLIKGTLLGTTVGFFIGINPIIFIFFAAFICLLPLVGTTLLWLPAATILYNRGDYGSAILCVLLCQVSIFGGNHICKKLGKKLHEHNTATSFFIFLSVIGGLVSFGVKGIVLGPMAVIIVMVIGKYWKDYYKDAQIKIIEP